MAPETKAVLELQPSLHPHIENPSERFNKRFFLCFFCMNNFSLKVVRPLGAAQYNHHLLLCVTRARGSTSVLAGSLRTRFIGKLLISSVKLKNLPVGRKS